MRDCAVPVWYESDGKRNFEIVSSNTLTALVAVVCILQTRAVNCAIIFGILFYAANAVFHFAIMDRTMSMVSIALLNTVFRVIIILLLFPLIGMIEKFVNTIIKEKKENIAELKDAERLEERFLNHPAIAIEQVRIAVNSMAGFACDSIREAMKIFDSFLTIC